MKKTEVLAIIPARGGSKGIPNKNLIDLCGKSLIQYTIDAAQSSRMICRTILSSDSDAIIQYCKAQGVEVPFQRPDRLAQDETLMMDVVRHCLDYLETSENYKPDIVVILQPTSPLRRAKHIDDALSLLEETGADSVVSVVSVPHHYNPVSVMKIVDGRLVSYLQGEGTGKLRRQDKPTVYARNGAAVYAVRRTTIIDDNSLFGDDSRPLIMDHEESVDIDTLFDLQVAESLLAKRQ
ncbi:MAG: acylneuraminate cytidylyltransferase family protein [Deltaproteobacteria bacterium]|nr:acylneuraminate cytidylyltransferase family protein [Deltaproteobacteria bacterium]